MPPRTGIFLDNEVEFRLNLNNVLEKQLTKARNAVEWVIRQMRDWIVTNHEDLGGWTNQTFALQNSMESAVFIDGLSIVGVVYAQQPYAIYVEYMEGHWVISGVLHEFREKAMELITSAIRAQR